MRLVGTAEPGGDLAVEHTVVVSRGRQKRADARILRRMMRRNPYRARSLRGLNAERGTTPGIGQRRNGTGSAVAQTVLDQSDSEMDQPDIANGDVKLGGTGGSGGEH